MNTAMKAALLILVLAALYAIASGADRVLKHRNRLRQIDDSMGALASWLNAGDPLGDAPDVEMGVWGPPEQAEYLDWLAGDMWPGREYEAIVAGHQRESS